GSTLTSMSRTAEGPPSLRHLPSVDALLRTEAGNKGAEKLGRSLLKLAVQRVLDDARNAAKRGVGPPSDEILLARAVRLAALNWYGVSWVVNATGVVLHTGLGRAPLPERAATAVAQVARNYSDLEVDRETGRRGRRTTRAETMLLALTGAEAALVVNNNAAALLLALAALARRRDVLVSRGELIEIGDEFRLPDIMAASGSKLVEVGTTNRTRVSDFASAVTERTGMLLKVHPSNYRVVGFAETPRPDELAGIAREHAIPFLYDLGSGLLDRYPGIPEEEPSAVEALAQGADLVCFSGDKLLGGPQAGILLGRADLVQRLRRHPIARAVRVDKLQITALEAVLRCYTTDRRDELPAWRMLEMPASILERRARAIASNLPGAEIRRCESTVGGGSLPGYTMPSWCVVVSVMRADSIAARLRTGKPPVFCRVEDDQLVFDLRTVPAEDDRHLLRAIVYALEQG
ncbi:MAG: L-seryl-tRNA(Sec) selenium transferase, partial [Actinobacteria bacterium]|nr:L-seryl-tRNA(Sec) selenium transferase [Actinomycetota bacterium]